MRPADTIRVLLARVRETLSRRRVAEELDEEMRFHREQEIAYNIARGMSPADARRAAELAFGGTQRYREEARDARGFAWLDGLARDVRFTLRRLRRAPVFSVGVIGTLAVGLGASAGIAALVYGVLLRPLPYDDPDRLVRVSVLTPGLRSSNTLHNDATFAFFQERARSFTAMGAYFENDAVSITDGASPERVTSAIITPNVFAMIGARAALGRVFRDEDAVADTLPVLISYDIWQRRFGGDSATVGKTIEVNRGARRIVGVLPRGFDFPSRSVSVWYPHAVKATRGELGSGYFYAVARLRAGTSPEAARAELVALTEHFHERFPNLSAEQVRQSGLRPDVQTLRAAIVEPVRAELTLLGIMIGVLLVIAAANVTTLFLLRAERLRPEVAVARALGASTRVIARRFIVEGWTIALAGGAAALPIAALAISTKFGFEPTQIPRLHDVRVDATLVAAMFAAVALVGTALGVVATARVRTTGALVVGSIRTTASAGWRRAQQVLVTTQIALALALLLGATLMGQSLARLRRVDIGFTARNAATFEAGLPFSGYSRYQLTAQFHHAVLERLASLPGVQSAAAAMQPPLAPRFSAAELRLVAGRDANAAATSGADASVVTPNYFATLGIPLERGRTFARGDLIAAEPAVIVSRALARELFGRTDVVGERIRLARSTRYPPYEIVGVAGDVYGERIQDGPLASVYFPLLPDIAPSSQDTARIPFNPSVTYIARGDVPLSTLTPAFRAIVRSIDARVPVANVTSLDEMVARATARVRLTLLLLSVAAAATLLLGAVGLYSVIAYAVAGRGPELAIRLALGATAPGIIGLVLREGAVVAALGIAAGVVVSLAGTRLIRGVLFEVSATNPVGYFVAVILLAFTVIVAMYVPARRAGRTNPAHALRGA